jgi:hypothetical protein
VKSRLHTYCSSTCDLYRYDAVGAYAVGKESADAVIDRAFAEAQRAVRGLYTLRIRCSTHSASESAPGLVSTLGIL